MLRWLKTNRLKVASFSAISGDIFMGLAGGSGLLHLSFQSAPYALMTVGGCIGLLGHIGLLVWGKGDKAPIVAATDTFKKTPPICLKPLFPWRYPLDFGFLCFIAANTMYLLAGIFLGNMALSICGALIATASLIGWLHPPEKLIFGKRSMQVTALLYLLGTFNNTVAGFMLDNVMILLASACFFICNFIFYTVRKENQSSYTQAYETAQK